MPSSFSAPSEFRVFISRQGRLKHYASQIASDLRKKNYIVQVEEDFRQESDTETTLEKISKYIRKCDAVIAIIGPSAGGFPSSKATEKFKACLPSPDLEATYSQWEVHFARHYQKRLSFYFLKGSDDPELLQEPRYLRDHQASYIRWLEYEVNVDRSYFTTADELARKILTEEWPLITLPPTSEEIASQNRFKKEIANLFALIGYAVNENCSHIPDRLHIVASSKRKSLPNLIAQCNFQSDGKSVVTLDEVARFTVHVTGLRTQGIIDHGYLVANVGFSGEALRYLESLPAGNFVFAVSYSELIYNLLNFDRYLQDYIIGYERSKESEHYVKLNVVETTPIPLTRNDLGIGDLLEIKRHGDGRQSAQYLVAPQVYLEDPRVSSFIDAENNVMIKPKEFLEYLQADEMDRTSQDEGNQQHCLLIFEAGVKELASKSNKPILVDLFRGAVPHSEKENLAFRGPLALIELLLASYDEFFDPAESTRNAQTRWRKDAAKFLKEFYSHHKTTGAGFKHQPSPDLIRNLKSHMMEALHIPIHNLNDETHVENLEKAWKKIGPLHLLPQEETIERLYRFVNQDDANLMILLADYGAGKTTVLRKFMYELASAKLGLPNDNTIRIPIFISLKDYNKVPDFIALVKSFLRENTDSSDGAYRAFEKLNSDGRLVILLDAFDEMLSRVTKPDRRRCFNQMSILLETEAKVIITGRPGYFPEFSEFQEIISSMNRETSKRSSILRHRIGCLQLLNEAQVEEFFMKAPTVESADVFKELIKRPNLMDLARRPVLASMIGNTAQAIKNLNNQIISARQIYELYTRRWIELEEDKGEFRVLINPEEKARFVRGLAMQMHLSGTLSIHYSDLDSSIGEYFNLEDTVSVDHFSNDIRTCSFLTCSSDGEYYFIHKSFMEYFCAKEFELLERSPFASQFNRPLTPEMIDLLDFRKLPTDYAVLGDRVLLAAFEDGIDLIRIRKEKALKDQDFEVAARSRDIEKELKSVIARAGDRASTFSSMRATVLEVSTLFDSLSKFPWNEIEGEHIWERIVDWREGRDIPA